MTCANPLLAQWVGEWLEVEKERSSKAVSTYKRAHEALKKCPLKFTHPSEARQLDGIGDMIEKKLIKKMEDHCEENGLPAPRRPKGKKRTIAPGDEDDSASPPKKARKPKPYIPGLRSGPYGIILALATLDEDDNKGVFKENVIELAQEHCEASYTVPSHANKHYTAWNSMKTLLEKDIVYRKGHPAKRYYLTEEGWEVARRITKSDPTKGRTDNFISRESVSPKVTSKSKSNNDLGDDNEEPSIAESQKKIDPSTDFIPMGKTDTLPDFEPIVLQPGTFTVHLVLDNREVRAKKDRDYIKDKLTERGVTPIVKACALGDFLWIAKLHDDQFLKRHGGEGDEIILDWIVERKRLDDLIGSIKDGRFHEQKFRLRKSGIKNVIYLIEEHSIDSEVQQRMGEAIQTAIISSQVVDKFVVKQTQKTDDSIRYIACMTNMLKGIYEKQDLYVIPSKVLTTRNYIPLLKHLRTTKPATNFHITYPAFASLASKSSTLNLRDVYLKMLMCTRGVTGEKALEMQKRWKTPVDLIEAYKNCGSGDDGRKKKMALISSQMGELVGRKKIAKAASVKISDVWGDEEYSEEVLA